MSSFPYTSKAVVYDSSKRPPYLDDCTINSIKPTQILIKTEYASINPVDIKLHAFTLRNKKYHTLRDFCGTVVEAGEDAKEKYSIGETVYGTLKNVGDETYIGTFTVIDINKDLVGKLPTSLTPNEGAALGVAFGTASEILEKVNDCKPLGPESKVLVLGGATSVGSFALETLKKYYNAGYVAATCSPSSFDYVKSYGADEVISYRVPSLSQDLVAFCKKHGFKFDAIVDTVGGRDAIAVFNDILKPVKEKSIYVTIQGDAQPATQYKEMFVNYLIGLPPTIFRYFFGRYYGINYNLVLYSSPKSFDIAPTLFATPGVKVPIDSEYPAEDIKDAWLKVDSTRARGKVVIKF